MFLPSNMPEMRMLRRKHYLPRGTPQGRGNLIFLLTNNMEESFKIMNGKDNFIAFQNNYRFYYYNLYYYGKVYNRVYRINMINKKRDMKNIVMAKTNCLYYPYKNLSSTDDIRSTYLDLSKYLEIFNSLTPNVNPLKKIELFWGYFKSAIFDKSYNRFTTKMMLIDVNNFKNIKGRIRDCISNPVYMLYYTLFRDYTLLKDFNLDIFLFTGQYTLRINPSKCGKNDYRKFLLELKKLYKFCNISIADELDEEKILEQERKEVIKDEIKTSFHFTGEEPIEGVITKLPEKAETDTKEEILDDIIDQKVDKAEEEIKDAGIEVTDPIDQLSATKAVKTNVENDMEVDEALLQEIYTLTRSNKVRKSAASTARDKLLREKQEDLVVKGMTVKKLKEINAKQVKIPTKKVGNVLKTTNRNFEELKFANLNQTYIEKVMDSDITNAILSLNDKSMPIFVRNITVEDTSDNLNYIDTYTVELEDANRKRSTIKVDIPKFIDSKFMLLGGNKKLILHQNFLLPLVKTDNDAVQIVTNYNKMYVRRHEAKSISSVERLNVMLRKNPKFFNKFKFGYVFPINKEYITTIEYDEISKSIVWYKDTGVEIYFDQASAMELAAKKDITIPKNKMFIGIRKGIPIFIDHDTQVDENGDNIVDIIMKCSSDENIWNEYNSNKTKVPARRMYAKVKTMNKDLPCIILCSFWEGFLPTLNKMGIKYQIHDKYPPDLGAKYAVIQFKDCYISYEDKVGDALMLNGLSLMPTKEYNLADMDTKDPYLNVFKKIYGKMSIANALDNTYEFTIDPITKEVLEDMNLPTDIVSLIIYAVRLLNDNQYTFETDQHLCRVRSIETIPAILYDSIAKNYITYKNSNGKKKFSIPRDTVIKKLLELKNVEDYSTLNPTLELERRHTISYKGWRGVNLDDSYTVPKRGYHETMVGILGIATSPDASVGVSRTLTIEPNVDSVRGYVNVTPKKDLDKLKDINLFSPGEMTMPMSAMTDDPTRLGHAIKQSKHVIPVKNSSPVLISNGAEEAIPHMLSSDFVVTAKQSGKVIEMDMEEQIMVVEYKDGSHQAVNLASNIVKNGGGGFYESLTLKTDFKVGDRFQENEIIAYNDKFFKNTKHMGCRLTMGVLTKIALMSTYNTYEDSTVITHRLSERASTEMCFQKAVVIGKNANVSKMANVGDYVEVGDILAEFDTSFEDESLNEFLKILESDPNLKDAVDEGSRNTIRSKYAGEIEDIKIYCTVDLDELSPSLRKIVKSYYNKINARKKVLDKYDSTNSIMKCGMLITDPSSKVNPSVYGVIRGNKVEDAVLVEFYIKHTEYLQVGSKLANFTGLKNVVGEIVPEGYEPYSEFRKDEEVGSMVASNSILKRMVPSLILTTLGNKCIVELKRSLKVIWDGSLDSKLKRKDMCNLIYTFFSAFDKSGENTKKYKNMFDPMSDTEFNRFFTSFFTEEDEYLILDIIDYERMITMEDVERAAKVIKVPLFEYVYLPYITMDKEMIIKTQEPVPVGYIHIKRPQQTLMKKNGISTSTDERSSMTGQVTGGDKNGRETDLENALLISVGLDATLRELNGPRADDPVMEKEMLRDISVNGFVKYEDLTYDVTNKVTLNTVNAFLLGMHLKSDLVTKGLALPKTLKEEL